jgi:hypothetical protein
MEDFQHSQVQPGLVRPFDAFNAQSEECQNPNECHSAPLTAGRRQLSRQKRTSQNFSKEADMKYLLRAKGLDSQALEEDLIVQMCLDGRIDQNALVLPYVGLGLTGGEKSILLVPAFKQAFEQKKVREKAEATKAILARAKSEAAQNPDPGLVLLVRDVLKPEGIQRLTVIQVKNLFMHGSLSADAEFKHPDYDDWFPCRLLFSSSPTSPPSKTIASQELCDLLQETRNVREECEKIKWAVRVTAFVLGAIVLFGIHLTLK